MSTMKTPLPWAAGSSPSSASPHTSPTNGVVSSEFALENDASPTAPTSRTAASEGGHHITPVDLVPAEPSATVFVMEDPLAVAPVVSIQTIAGVLVLCSTECPAYDTKGLMSASIPAAAQILSTITATSDGTVKDNDDTCWKDSMYQGAHEDNTMMISNVESPPSQLTGMISTGYSRTREWQWLMHAPSRPPDALDCACVVFPLWQPLLPAPVPKPPWLLPGHELLLPWPSKKPTCLAIQNLGAQECLLVTAGCLDRIDWRTMICATQWSSANFEDSAFTWPMTDFNDLPLRVQEWASAIQCAQHACVASYALSWHERQTTDFLLPIVVNGPVLTLLCHGSPDSFWVAELLKGAKQLQCTKRVQGLTGELLVEVRICQSIIEAKQPDTTHGLERVCKLGVQLFTRPSSVIYLLVCVSASVFKQWHIHGFSFLFTERASEERYDLALLQWEIAWQLVGEYFEVSTAVQFSVADVQYLLTGTAGIFLFTELWVTGFILQYFQWHAAWALPIFVILKVSQYVLARVCSQSQEYYPGAHYCHGIILEGCPSTSYTMVLLLYWNHVYLNPCIWYPALQCTTTSLMQICTTVYGNQCPFKGIRYGVSLKCNHYKCCLEVYLIFSSGNLGGLAYPDLSNSRVPVLIHHSRRLVLSVQCDDEDGIVTKKHHRVLVRHTKTPWDPGRGSTWCQWFSPGNNQVSFQRGRRSPLKPEGATIGAQLNRCIQQWDPGGLTVDRLGDKPSFKGGRDVRSPFLSYLDRPHGPPYGLGPARSQQ